MPRSKTRSRILLVNGERTLQYLRALMLRMKGYEVHTADTIDKAKTELSLRKFKLVIIDVGYFAGPGLNFCEEIKKMYPRLKVLMQTNHATSLDRNSCPDKVISKQDGPQSFISEVEEMLPTTEPTT